MAREQTLLATNTAVKHAQLPGGQTFPLKRVLTLQISVLGQEQSRKLGLSYNAVCSGTFQMMEKVSTQVEGRDGWTGWLPAAEAGNQRFITPVNFLMEERCVLRNKKKGKNMFLP